MRYALAAYTDPGGRKPVNQDSFCLRRAVCQDGPQGVLAVVCDGMGGLSRGEAASGLLTWKLGRWFDQRAEELLRRGLPPMLDEVRRELSDLVAATGQTLAELGRESGGPMGTTLALLLAVGRSYLTAHLGDSRVYAVGRTARPLTQDHSLVAREVAAGRMTPQEALRHPSRNVLLRCVGAGPGGPVEFSTGRVRRGFYLLCSDGFVHQLAPREMAQALPPAISQDSCAMAAALRDLTGRCKARGETDNITAVVLGAQPRPLLERLAGGGRGPVAMTDCLEYVAALP